MIRVTLDPSIQHKFETQFPHLSEDATRIFNRYCKKLAEEIEFAYTKKNYNEDTGTINLAIDRLNQNGGAYYPYMNNKKNKVKIGYWIRDEYPIYSIISPAVSGSKYTEILFNSKVTIIDIAAQTTELMQSTIDEITNMKYEKERVLPINEFQTLLAESTNIELFKQLYPEYKNGMDYTKFIEYNDHRELFDAMPVDIRSLEAGIYWFNNNNINDKNRKSITVQLSTILRIATLTKFSSTHGYFYQRKINSKYGRIYYKGVSIHSIPSAYRRMIIGDAYHFDFKTCAISFKMCDRFIKTYLAQIGKPNGKVEEEISATHFYLVNKKEFFGILKRDIFNDCPTYSDAFRESLLKQCLLALSFGARSSMNTCWYDKFGDKKYGAINEILQNREIRERFYTHPLIIEFTAEQKILDQIIADYVMTLPEHAEALSVINDGKSASKGQKVAYLYQHWETVLMNRFLNLANALNLPNVKNYYKVKARIHDGIILNHDISVKDLWTIKCVLIDEFKNKYIDIKKEIIEKYTYMIPESTVQSEIAHKEHMIKETLLAKQYANIKTERYVNGFVKTDEMIGLDFNPVDPVQLYNDFCNFYEY